MCVFLSERESVCVRDSERERERERAKVVAFFCLT